MVVSALATARQFYPPSARPFCCTPPEVGCHGPSNKMPHRIAFHTYAVSSSSESNRPARSCRRQLMSQPAFQPTPTCLHGPLLCAAHRACIIALLLIQIYLHTCLYYTILTCRACVPAAPYLEYMPLLHIRLPTWHMRCNSVALHTDQLHSRCSSRTPCSFAIPRPEHILTTSYFIQIMSNHPTIHHHAVPRCRGIPGHHEETWPQHHPSHPLAPRFSSPL